MSKRVTQGDFQATINDQVFFGATEAGVKKAGKECFELAKRMAIEFTVYQFEKTSLPIGRNIHPVYNNDGSARTASTEELFELYQNNIK